MVNSDWYPMSKRMGQTPYTIERYLKKKYVVYNITISSMIFVWQNMSSR